MVLPVLVGHSRTTILAHVPKSSHSLGYTAAPASRAVSLNINEIGIVYQSAELSVVFSVRVCESFLSATLIGHSSIPVQLVRCDSCRPNIRIGSELYTAACSRITHMSVM